MTESFLMFTVGHSTRPLDRFLDILRAYGIRQVVDVRSIPRSRHNPQFDRVVLARFLRGRRINYRHMKGLGGLRHARRDSVNTGWVNASFRGFADYMQTPGFAAAIDTLMRIARRRRTVLMCAEAVPWRCHRSLIADALSLRAVEVRHILSASSSRHHELTPFARVSGLKVTYPAEAAGRGLKTAAGTL